MSLNVREIKMRATKKLKVNGIALAVSASLMSSVFCSSLQANVLIEGFAQWQADRIEKIVLDQALFSLMKDDYVQTFFPATTEAVNSYGGSTSAQRLIPLIQAMIDKDIKDIEFVFTKQIKSYLGNVEEQFEKGQIDAAIDNLLAFELALRRSNKDIQQWYDDFRSVIQTTGSAETDQSFEDSIIKRESDAFSGKLRAFEGFDFTKNVSNADAKKVLDVVARFEKISEEKTKDKAPKEDNKLLEDRLKKMIAVINQYEDSKKLYDKADDKKAIIAIHFFVRFFELFGAEDQNYTEFKSFGLFLGALIEADGPDAVAAVLDSFVDEQSAYRNKRLDANNTLYSKFYLPAFNAATGETEPMAFSGYCKFCSNTLFVGSYFGGALMHLTNEESMEREYQVRAFGPVGLEYKFMSYYGAPVSLNIAPFDVGNYVSNELRDVEYTARFSDIVAPSIFLSYSFKSRPFSIMAGYQKDVKVGNAIEENTFFLSFAFDLPIYTIF